MKINGKLFTVEFKRWIHPSRNDDKVIELHSDDVLAQFELSKWTCDKGKITLDQIYHTLNNLLDIEECLTCSKEGASFFMELDEIEKAIKAYKGKADTTPKPHSLCGEEFGFYLRQ